MPSSNQTSSSNNLSRTRNNNKALVAHRNRSSNRRMVGVRTVHNSSSSLPIKTTRTVSGATRTIRMDPIKTTRSNNQIKHLQTHKVPHWSPSIPCPSRKRSTLHSRRCGSDSNKEMFPAAYRTRVRQGRSSNPVPMGPVFPTRRASNSSSNRVYRIPASPQVACPTEVPWVGAPVRWDRIRMHRSEWEEWEWVRTGG